MKNLLNPNIQCTDPDNLQFCLKVSNKEFWYCQPNGYYDKLLPESDTVELELLSKYMGHSKNLLEDAEKNVELKAILSNLQLWLTGSIDIDGFNHEEKLELLDDYGYSWDDFSSDAERNQIICENYFEQNLMEFRNDI